MFNPLETHHFTLYRGLTPYADFLDPPRPIDTYSFIYFNLIIIFSCYMIRILRTEELLDRYKAKEQKYNTDKMWNPTDRKSCRNICYLEHRWCSNWGKNEESEDARHCHLILLICQVTLLCILIICQFKPSCKDQKSPPQINYRDLSGLISAWFSSPF